MVVAMTILGRASQGRVFEEGPCWKFLMLCVVLIQGGGVVDDVWVCFCCVLYDNIEMQYLMFQ